MNLKPTAPEFLDWQDGWMVEYLEVFVVEMRRKVVLLEQMSLNPVLLRQSA